MRREVGRTFQAEEMLWARAMRWEVAQVSRGWDKSQSGRNAEHKEICGDHQGQVTRQAGHGQTMLGITDLAKESVLSSQEQCKPFLLCTGHFWKQPFFARIAKCSVPKTGYTPR